MRNVQLGQLKAWANNPRRGNQDPEHIAELKASIKVEGVLQNLIVVPEPGVAEIFIVIAGDSRFTALTGLKNDGDIDETYPVPVDVKDIDINDTKALEIALAENAIRRQMAMIDECAGMAELASKGKTAEDIAASFGLKTKTVKQRIALGRLASEARELIRNNTRDLDWGRALTLADAATQAKICNDVAMNPASWRDAVEIRRYLTSETIPVDHALFDPAEYKGRMISDMFDGDRIADRAEFWDLQNKAIEAMTTELKAEGWGAVEVSHNPVDTWRYRSSDNKAESKVIIEVSPNGKVTLHKGLVDPAPAANDPNAQADILEIEQAPAEDADLQGDAVRLTPAIAEYAAAHRSAMVQAEIGNGANFRAALEIAVAGLIGHGEIAIRAQDYRFPGAHDIRTGAGFRAAGEIRDGIAQTLTDGGIPATNRDDAMVLAMVRRLDDTALQLLFGRLVASKVGQPNARRLDGAAGSLLNSTGRQLGIDVRKHWTPDEKFFSLMQAPDLRRVATALLPQDRQSGLMTAKKPHLVKMLTEAFADAAENDGSLDATTAARLNAWVPGPMMFPAEDDALRAPAGAESDGDAFAALFEGGDEGTELPDAAD